MMLFAFSINFFCSHPPFLKIMDGFIPNIPQSVSFTGVIGAIIMPQNIFLHSSLVQTRKEENFTNKVKLRMFVICLLYTSPSPRDLSTSRMPSSA